MSNIVYDRIPDEIPARSVHSLGINWVAEDSEDVPWDIATVTSSEGVTLLKDQSLDDIPLDEMVLVNALPWEQIDMAVIADVPVRIADTENSEGSVGTWQTLLLFGLNGLNGDLEVVSVPLVAFGDENVPNVFRYHIANELKKLYDAGHLETVEGNLEWFFLFVGKDAPKQGPFPA